MSKKHGGHHGGAWKVAYADFVTAMMALFLVLWLTSQDTKIKEAVERSFRHPWQSLKPGGSGIINQSELNSAKPSPAPRGNALEYEWLRRLHKDLMKALQSDENENKAVELELLNDQLRISIFDRSGKPIFEADSDQFTEYGGWVFSTLAWEIRRYESFNIELEGHTERGHVATRPDFGKWELSAARALAARRKLIHHDVREEQIRKVSGYADTMPMKNHVPEDEINRRVTVMLRLGNESKP